MSSSNTNSYFVSAGNAAVRLQGKEKSFGWKRGSIATRNELSSSSLMTQLRRGQGSSKQGFVLHSIK